MRGEAKEAEIVKERERYVCWSAHSYRDYRPGSARETAANARTSESELRASIHWASSEMGKVSRQVRRRVPSAGDEERSPSRAREAASQCAEASLPRESGTPTCDIVWHGSPSLTELLSFLSLSLCPPPSHTIFRALNELSVYASATRGNCLSARWRRKKRVAPFTAPHVLARYDHHRRRWLKDLHGREIGYEGYLFEGRL